MKIHIKKSSAYCRSCRSIKDLDNNYYRKLLVIKGAWNRDSFYLCRSCAKELVKLLENIDIKSISEPKGAQIPEIEEDLSDI